MTQRMQNEEAPQSHCVLCVDIGGTTSKVGVLRWPNPVVSHEVIPTRGPASEFADALSSAIRRVRTLESAACAEGIGVAVAGMLDDDRTRLLYNPNIFWLEGYPLQEHLVRELQLPVDLEADSTAATLGEAYFGAGQGIARFMCVAVGTGIGVGMILNGEPLRLAYGCLGDPGHIKVQPDGELCPCGGRGCAEVLVSAPVLAKRYREAAGRTDECTLRDVIEAARGGDSIALRILSEAGHWLGILNASLADTFFPECIAVAGGLAEADSLVMEALQAGFQAHASQFARERVTVKRARLGAMATLAGAALAVFRPGSSDAHAPVRKSN